MLVLISVTNNKCATITNQSRDLVSKIETKSRKVPRIIRNATNKMITAHKKFKIDDIFTNPSAAYNYLRTCRNAKPKQIEPLSVGAELYTGQAVCDGFYASMTSVKQCDMNKLRNDPLLANKFINYEQIVKICQDQPPIPPVSLEKSTKILKSLKKNVNDIFSITAGQEGLTHYNLLLNATISDVNNANIE